jgi:hypothetical protein
MRAENRRGALEIYEVRERPSRMAFPWAIRFRTSPLGFAITYIPGVALVTFITS